MSRILEELRTEGRFESEGHFSLDVAKALEKMRQYQLEDARLYVLNLLASAVAQGATRIAAESLPDSFKLEFDGPGFGFEDFAELFSSLFVAHDRAKVPLQELAIGLHGTRSLSLRKVMVESRARLVITRDRLEIEQLPAGSPPGTRITVQEKVNLADRALGLFERLRKEPAPTAESDYIRHDFRLCHVPVLLNGTRVNPPLRFEKPVAIGLLTGPAGQEVELEESMQPFVAFRRPSGGDFWACLVLENEPNASKPTQLVVNGQVFPMKKRDDLKLGYGGSRLIMHMPFLRKDLSQRQITTDEAFWSAFESVKRATDGLALDVLVRLPEHEDLVIDTLIRRLRRSPQQGLKIPTTVSQPGMALAREMADVKLFRLASGSPISLGALARQYVRYGYLPATDAVPEEPVPPVLEDGSAVVYGSQKRRQLLGNFFSNQPPVHVREGRYTIPAYDLVPRLEGEFLARRVSSQSRMEIGVPAAPPAEGVWMKLVKPGGVLFEGVESSLELPIPRGLHILAHAEQRSDDPAFETVSEFSKVWKRVVTAASHHVQDLMEALLWELPEEPGRTWVAGYVLECFDLAARHFRKQQLDLFLELIAREQGSSLFNINLRSLAKAPLLPTSGGRLRSIASIGHAEKPVPARVVEDVTRFSDGPEQLLLLPRQADILAAFFGPRIFIQTS